MEDQIITNGTSLVVRQFVALARGEDVPHVPCNPWRILAMVPVQRYCKHCFGAHWFDVVQAVTVDGKPVEIRFCRCCGGEA